ncbi:hypothetical protein BD770DRAFT_416993, partial [Pilaira anomala]
MENTFEASNNEGIQGHFYFESDNDSSNYSMKESVTSSRSDTDNVPIEDELHADSHHSNDNNVPLSEAGNLDMLDGEEDYYDCDPYEMQVEKDDNNEFTRVDQDVTEVAGDDDEMNTADNYFSEENNKCTSRKKSGSIIVEDEQIVEKASSSAQVDNAEKSFFSEESSKENIEKEKEKVEYKNIPLMINDDVIEIISSDDEMVINETDRE